MNFYLQNDFLMILNIWLSAICLETCIKLNKLKSELVLDISRLANKS